MKKIKISIPVDYIMGHLRYGHLEGEVVLTDEEFEKFTSDPVQAFEELQLDNDLEVKVDDWHIDDIGDLVYEDMTYEYFEEI